MKLFPIHKQFIGLDIHRAHITACASIVLTDAGIRLGVVVSDIHGQSARAMIKGILRGQAVGILRNFFT